MKQIKRIVSLLLAVLLLAAVGTTAFAANITIDGGAAGAEYAAYKLLNATDGGDNKFAYTVNDDYRAALKKALIKILNPEEDLDIGMFEVTDTEIISYIAGLTGDQVRNFADAVYAEVKDMTPDYTTTTDVFTGVDQGYYLIAETKTGNAQDTHSLAILDTAGKENIKVETKEDVPTLEKKVQEKNDSTGATSGWQDGADYDIGDDVPFKLTGTLPNNYDEYETYYYVFHDQMDKSLTFNEGSVVVKVDGEIITTGYRVEWPARDKDTFDVVFDDLKQIESVTEDSVITIEFTAELNEDAVIGNPGNPNEAKLEYSNNPYDEGDGKPETGETPEDKVVVFTYELNADKVDGEGDALEGAGFTLYKWNDDRNDWVAVGDEIDGVTTFTFTGLDAGEYKLVETTVPDGYNKAEDIYFTIEAVYDTNSDDPKLTDLVVKDEDGNVISDGEDAVFNTSITDGSVNTDVVNNSGIELPETGGVGTTLFYVIGGLLMAAAAVLLITKKKMSAHKD